MLYPELVHLVFLTKNRKMRWISLKNLANQEKAGTEDIMTAIILIAILILLFFAPNLAVFFFFLFSGIIIGLIGLFRRKER